MGLMVECPDCKHRNSTKEKTCRCGFALAKFSGRVWWVEWYQDGRRKRERIGPNKAAAEQRLREVLSARTEGRYIRKNPDTRTLFRDLATWYLNLPEVRAKRSYLRDTQLIANLVPYFGDRLLKDISPAMVEAYKQKRLSDPSGRTPEKNTAPATVNREVACLKVIFNRAVNNGKAERNPTKGVKLLKENNERDRLLSSEEYERLLAHSPEKLKPIIKVAYHTGMRQKEILYLTWGQVDLKDGFILLEPEDTKTKDARLVPLNHELMQMFKGMPRGFPNMRVFPYRGKAFGSSFQRAFETARKEAGIEGFLFHDMRHTAINNWRLQGHDYFRIMAASGHKTMTVFKRYNTVSREELKMLVAEKK
jgi:integrase